MPWLVVDDKICRRRCGSDIRSPRRVNVAGVCISSTRAGGGTDRGGTRRVILVGVRISLADASFLTWVGKTVGLLLRAFGPLGLAEVALPQGDDAAADDIDGDAVWDRLASAVSASGGLYIVLGRRWRLPGPKAASPSDVGASDDAGGGVGVADNGSGVETTAFFSDRAGV